MIDSYSDDYHYGDDDGPSGLRVRQEENPPPPEPEPYPVLEFRSDRLLLIRVVDSGSIAPIEVLNHPFFVGSESPRHPQECWMRLKDPLVSRKHAALICTDGVWFLLDLASTNGSEVRPDNQAAWKTIGKEGMPNPYPIPSEIFVRFGNSEFLIRVG
jgi:hypothetical protein